MWFEYWLGLSVGFSVCLNVDNKLSSFWGGSGFVMSPQWVPLPRSKITVCPSDYDHFVWTESLSVASSTLWLYSCCINSISTQLQLLQLLCVCPLNVCVMGNNQSTLVAVLPMENSTLVSTISCLDLWERCHISLFTSLGSCGCPFSEYSVGECHVLVSLCRRLSPEFSGMYST